MKKEYKNKWIAALRSGNFNGKPCSIVLLNDYHGLSFNQIADLIEQQVPAN